MTYTELHCHSAYSFLDGVSLPEELAATALELGHQTLALTDHDGVYGSMEFAHAARGLGLRPIHGAELSLRDGRHLTLLVASERGWRNLCRLLTLAHADTRVRLRDPAPPRVSLEVVCAHAGGLACLTGCAQGQVGKPAFSPHENVLWLITPRHKKRLAQLYRTRNYELITF